MNQGDPMTSVSYQDNMNPYPRSVYFVRTASGESSIYSPSHDGSPEFFPIEGLSDDSYKKLLRVSGDNPNENPEWRRTYSKLRRASAIIGASTVAIDNKIEQAMDLVKSHLMFAVREEVLVLKEQIKELLEKNSQLEYENSVLRNGASAETLDTLAKLQPATNPGQTQQTQSSS